MSEVKNQVEMEERALAWDDEIEKESEFVLLPPGDYEFEITSLERERFDGSDKMSACPMAVLNLAIASKEGRANVQTRLFLHTKAEWKISEFFTSIGLKKKGEKLKMQWNKVVGAKGRCKIGQRKYTTNNGEERVSNEVKKFYPAEEKKPNLPEGMKEFTEGTF